MRALLADATLSDEALRALVELGLHHEQQHQELILTDVKHLLSLNPLRPAYRSALRRITRGCRAPLRMAACAGGAARDRPRRARASPSTTSGRATACSSHRSSSRAAPGRPAASSSPSSRTAATGGPELWLSDGWDAPCRRSAGDAPLYWRAARRRLARVHARGPAAARPPSRSATSATTRPTPSRAGPARACPRGGVGDAARALPAAGNFVESGAAPAAAASRRRAAQLFGDVWEWTRERLRALSRLPRLPRARSASTTASSCPTRSCCAAAPAPRRRATSRAHATATSSRRARAGSSAACASRAMQPDAARSVADYRQLAADYDRRTRWIDAQRRRAVEALALRPGDTVLDAGCGSGMVPAETRARRGRARARRRIDPSPDMLAVAGGRFAPAPPPGVRLIEAAAETVALPEPVDAILFSYTHDIIRSAALTNVLRQARPAPAWRPPAPSCTASWLLPADWYLRATHRAYITDFDGFDAPWSLLAQHLDDFRVRHPFTQHYVATGTVRGLDASRPSSRRPRSTSGGSSRSRKRAAARRTRRRVLVRVLGVDALAGGEARASPPGQRTTCLRRASRCISMRDRPPRRRTRRVP